MTDAVSPGWEPKEPSVSCCLRSHATPRRIAVSTAAWSIAGRVVYPRLAHDPDRR